MERGMWKMIGVLYLGFFSYLVKDTKGDKCECGLSRSLEKQDRANVRDKIQMGIVNPPYKYPWMVTVFFYGKKYCEGSIISDYYVLTAAHCLIKPDCFDSSELRSDCYIDPNSLAIHFASAVPKFGRNLAIQSTIVHPEFRTSSIKYDIALLKTTRKIPCSRETAPICLPTNLNLLRMYRKATAVARAEKTQEDVSQKSVLREVQFRILPRRECKKKLKVPTNAHFCAEGNWHNTCKGASGGPLFVKHKGRHYAIGVTSAGNKPDCDGPTLEFFTKVDTFLPWMQNEADLE